MQQGLVVEIFRGWFWSQTRPNQIPNRRESKDEQNETDRSQIGVRNQKLWPKQWRRARQRATNRCHRNLPDGIAGKERGIVSRPMPAWSNRWHRGARTQHLIRCHRFSTDGIGPRTTATRISSDAIGHQPMASVPSVSERDFPHLSHFLYFWLLKPFVIYFYALKFLDYK